MLAEGRKSSSSSFRATEEEDLLRHDSVSGTVKSGGIDKDGSENALPSRITGFEGYSFRVCPKCAGDSPGPSIPNILLTLADES